MCVCVGWMRCWWLKLRALSHCSVLVGLGVGVPFFQSARLAVEQRGSYIQPLSLPCAICISSIHCFHTMSDIYTYTALINTSSSVSTIAAFLSQPILITWDNVLFVFIVCRQDHTVTQIIWNFIDWRSPLQKMECVGQPMSADHLTMRFRLLSMPHLCQQAN